MTGKAQATICDLKTANTCLIRRLRCIGYLKAIGPEIVGSVFG